MAQAPWKAFWPTPWQILAGKTQGVRGSAWATGVAVVAYACGVMFGAFATFPSRWGTGGHGASMMTIWAHNEVMVLIMAASGLATFGIATVVLLLYNGFLASWIFFQSLGHWTLMHALVVLVPHAVFELPATFLGSRLGLMGVVTLLKHDSLRGLWSRQFWTWVLVTIASVTALLAVAAVLEVAIT